MTTSPQQFIADDANARWYIFAHYEIWIIPLAVVLIGLVSWVYQTYYDSE